MIYRKTREQGSFEMKLIDADKGKIVVEINDTDIDVISGLFAMISALPNPGWEDSTGQEDTAITPEQFDRVYDEWNSLFDDPKAKSYFAGKIGEQP
jgi:hypothetical protein